MSASIVLAVFALLPPGSGDWIALAAVALLVLSLPLKKPLPLAWGVFVLTKVSISSFAPALDFWPTHLLLPLLVAGLCFVWGRRRSGDRTSLFELGSFGTEVQLLTVVVVVLSAAIFVAWVWLAAPRTEGALVPRNASWIATVGVGVVFAVVNAALEEFAFRGLALRALVTSGCHSGAAILIQAAAFGALHYSSSSVPPGAAGVVLTFLYGTALGVLACAAGGLWAPFLAHFVADALVYGVMMTGAGGG